MEQTEIVDYRYLYLMPVN